MQIPCFPSYVCPPILAYTDDAGVQHPLLRCPPNGDFLFPTFLPQHSLEFYREEELSFLFIHLFIQSFIYIPMDSWVFILFCGV